eukprot:Hpha_TRINITY_DN13034_c0_g1::TRINITY_DN13034_c0_g1_i1::g.68879::m.68879
MTENVIVATRARPLTPQEEERVGRGDIHNYTLRMDAKHTVFVDPATSLARPFQFDHNFWSLGNPHAPSFASQRVIFEQLGLPLLSHAFNGYNACVFAYGQTSSGKTYTMMGPPSDTALRGGTHAGLIPRLCDELFRKVTDLHAASKECKIQVEMSYYEIYNERMYDLLDPDNSDCLRVREDRKAVYVDGLTECPVEHFLQIQELLKVGNRRRHTASTRMNDRSSRSHAVFCLVIRKREWHSTEGDTSVFTSRVNMVDLAGSERTLKAGTEGSTLREGININLGLHKLGLVIRKLADLSDRSQKRDSEFVPYRDSLLTRVLQENLGGSSRTVMLATLSPCSMNADETLNTLRYAERVKFIKNTPIVNESSGNSQITALRRKIRDLESQLSGRAYLPRGLLLRAGLDGYGPGTYGSLRGTSLRVHGPALVLADRPRIGGVVVCSLPEGFTIVSDVVPLAEPPVRMRDDDRNPDSPRNDIGGNVSFGDLTSPVETGDFDGFNASFGLDETTRRALKNSGLQKTNSIYGRKTKRRNSGQASYMNATLSSGFKDKATAAVLEDAGKEGALERSVAHTMLQSNNKGNESFRGARAAVAETGGKGRRARGESEASRSRSPRPRAKAGKYSIAKAFQAAKEKITKLELEGREPSCTHILDNDDEISGFIVNPEEDPMIDSPVRGEREIDSPQRRLPPPGTSFESRGGGGNGRPPLSSSVNIKPLALEEVTRNQEEQVGSARRDDFGSARSADGGMTANAVATLQKLWDSSGTPALRPTVQDLQSLPDETGMNGVLHLRLRGGVPGVGCPHALIRRVGQQVWLMPLDGDTLINGRTAGERGAHPLRPGAVVRFGEHEPFTFVVPTDEEGEETLDPLSLSLSGNRRAGSVQHHPRTPTRVPEEVQQLRDELAVQEMRLATASQELMAERQLRCNVGDLRRELAAVHDERSDMRRALRESNKETEELRQQLADSETNALVSVCQRENAKGSASGLQLQVFRKTADGLFWRPVGPPFGEEGEEGHFVLVDERESAVGTLQKQVGSLKAALRRTEGDLLTAQQETAEAESQVLAAREAVMEARKEAENIRDEAASQMAELQRGTELLRGELEQAEEVRVINEEQEVKIEELQKEGTVLVQRVAALKEKERDRERERISTEASRHRELESRLQSVQDQEWSKLRQIDVLQERIDALKTEMTELTEEKSRKLTELSAEIDQKLAEKAAAAAELKEVQMRVVALREEEEKRRGLMEKLRRQRDDRMESKELITMDEVSSGGWRLDDATFRRKGISLSRQSRAPVRVVLASSALRVFNASASDVSSRGPGAPPPGYRRPASPMPLSSTSSPAQPVREVRYDSIKTVKQLDGEVLVIDAQDQRDPLYLVCDDRIRRNTVHKLLLLRTKGVMVPLRGTADYDEAQVPTGTATVNGSASRSATPQYHPPPIERLPQRARSPMPHNRPSPRMR